MRLTRGWGLVMGLAAAALIAWALWLGFTAPEDYQQGDTVRIMFVHVPAAWVSLAAYVALGGASLSAFVWRHSLAEAAAKTCAPLGAAFTVLALITGSLWGRPMWGAWWVWDARLTSVVVLLLFYLGCIALRAAMDDETRGGRAAAILAMVGLVNLPIVKFSVDWWSTLHQPASVFRADGPTMTPDYLWPLLIMGLGYSLLFAALWITAIRTEVMRRRLSARAARLAGDA
ncbi:heme ABC transporter permease [Brevundimonas sp.]|uniref:heme ABC transporter permease n=1 Tax=Brevundimonas sp. TaxID=1871086 RepID=UPI0025CEEF9A|nr:heme ABC transporter permease [Brevundimonas sp.]